MSGCRLLLSSDGLTVLGRILQQLTSSMKWDGDGEMLLFLRRAMFGSEWLWVNEVFLWKRAI